MGHLIVDLHGGKNNNSNNNNMSVADIREKFYNQSNEAFEELAALAEYLESRVAELEGERGEKEEQAKNKIELLRGSAAHQREKLHRLREKYAVLLDAYNELAEEAKDRSDSSSSSDDDDDNCSLM